MPKIALAQIACYPGELERNRDSICSTIHRAKKIGAELVVFPEMTLHGYMHLDLAHSKNYIDAGLSLLTEIAKECDTISALVGHLNRDVGRQAPGKRPYASNSVSLLAGGKVSATSSKVLLPQYAIFNEGRYYQAGATPLTVSVGEKRCGVLICEDLMGRDYDGSPLDLLFAQKPDCIVALNASPFRIGKWQSRFDRVIEVARTNQMPIYYTNLVGSYDGYDGEIVFDGRSFCVDKCGTLTTLGKEFEEDFLLIDVKSQSECIKPNTDEVSQAHDALVLGIQEFFKRAKCTKAVLGLSGGIDSALVAALATTALGNENVTTITMPSHITSNETKSDAHALAQNLGCAIFERSISPEYEAWHTEFLKASAGKEPGSMTKQNKQARIRGAILMEYTNEHPGTLLLTTGNKTELALGYNTLYGDLCGALAVIGDVDKDLVYKLSERINQQAGKELIPQSTIDRTPTAELEADQTDEASLPADYQTLVPLVDAIIESDISREELITEYDSAVVDNVLRLIDLNEGKRRQMPPAIRITWGSLGLETRMPMGVGYRAR